MMLVAVLVGMRDRRTMVYQVAVIIAAVISVALSVADVSYDIKRLRSVQDLCPFVFIQDNLFTPDIAK